MSELLTDEQLAERAGFYLRSKMPDAFSHLAEMEFAHICAEQEPALLARLREAERTLEDIGKHYHEIAGEMYSRSMIGHLVEDYFARVNE